MSIRFDYGQAAVAVPLPDWVPCSHCTYSLVAHVDLKCPFDSAQFNPLDADEIWDTIGTAKKLAQGNPTWWTFLSDARKQAFYFEARKRRLLKQIYR